VRFAPFFKSLHNTCIYAGLRKEAEMIGINGHTEQLRHVMKASTKQFPC